MNFHCKHPLHKTSNITILIFILVISFTHVFGQQTAKRTGGTPNIGFLEHLPAGYAANSSKTYPVLIFFHGASEKGSGSAADLEKIKVQGPPMHIENGDDMCFTVNGRQHCFIVISPQLPTGEDEWSNTYTTKVIDYVLANYRVNTSRLYLTGLSLGAHGIYLLAKQNGAGNAYIPKIAAVVNASGACPVYELDASKFVPVPLWAFHNETDPVVKINNERLFLQRINNLNPAKPPVFSVFNVSNHNTWTKAYQLSRSNWTSYNEFQNSSSSSVQSTNSYEWLLTHCKGNCNDGPADTMPFPTGLTASMVNGNVKLQWNDNASNETAYILERRIVGCDNTGSGTAPAPNFVAVAELPANSTSFTDDTPSQGCTYEYRIKASNATQNSAYSQLVSIKVEADIPEPPVTGLTRRMLIDLGAASTQTTGTGWSNSTHGFTGNISSLKDQVGGSTGISFVIATSAEGGYDNNGIGVNPEGYKGAVGNYPKSAAQDSYYAYGSTPGVYKLTGLDNSKVYEITLFGSRTVTGTNTISRVGVYTIAGVSKTLNAFNNASNTVTFSNLAPLNGEISLSFKAQDPAGFGYINFIDVKEFTPAADALGVPTAFIVSSVTANSVSLSWTDNASQETGFEIERKSGTDSYAKITTTAANIASYTDNTVTTDVTYYYRIRAINQTAASVYSAEISATPNAAGGNPTVLRKFLLDLGADSTQTTTAGWNNGTNGTITGTNISNLKESNGSSSSINFVIVRPADNDYEEIEANLTGRPGVNPDGCKNCDLTYPVSATQDSYFAWGTTPGSYKFTGLDNTKKYNLRIFASRMSTNSETRVGLYQINGESKTLDAKNNITNTITFTDLVPASGELVLSFGVATGSKFAYINTLELEEVGATTTPVDPPVAGLNRRMLLDLGADSTQTIATGWSNSTHGFTGNISSLQDDKGATTGISFVIATSAEGGFDHNGIGVNPDGYKGAVGEYPKNAAGDSFYAYGSTPGVYKLTGLDNSKVYEITLFGSRTVTGTNSISRVGVYTIAGVAKTLDALNNTSQTVTFSNLIPQNGEIGITFKAQDPAGFGYINFIDIKEYTPGTDPGEPGDPVLDYTLLVNFTDGSTTGDAPWNNTNAAPVGNLTFSNLKDDQGSNQQVSITLTSSGFAANDKGMVTGNNSGAAPDNVLKSYYYTSSASGETLKVSGLRPEMTYRFTFIASNSYTGDRTGIYSIGDKSMSLNAAQNSSKTVNIDQVVPNGNGEVIITVKRAASASYAFLNALKIEGFGTGGGGTPVVTRQMLMDLGADSTRTTGIGWSNSTQGFTGNISSLQDDKGASTSIGFVIVTSAEGGFDNNGIGVNPDGYKGAVGSYPKSAAQDSYYAYGSTPGVYKLTGLDNNRRYELILFASRMVSGNNNLNRTGVYTIAGETKSLDALNNSSKTVTFSNVTPQNGEISITFKAQDPTGFGYLNFVDIKEYTQGTGPLDPDTPDYTSPPVIESVADQTLYTEVSYSLQLKASQGKATSGKDKLNIVVLGSSTAEGYNLVDKSYSFVGLLSSYMNTTYPGSTVTNLGKGGYTTYHVLPDGTSATANRPPVDPERNITKALSLNPDLIVISLPSNDLAGGFC